VAGRHIRLGLVCVRAEEVKIGILLGSFASAVAGYLLPRFRPAAKRLTSLPKAMPRRMKSWY